MSSWLRNGNDGTSPPSLYDLLSRRGCDCLHSGLVIPSIGHKLVKRCRLYLRKFNDSCVQESYDYHQHEASRDGMLEMICSPATNER